MLLNNVQYIFNGKEAQMLFYVLRNVNPSTAAVSEFSSDSRGTFIISQKTVKQFIKQQLGPEEQSLYAERAHLIDKSMEQGLSQEEKYRLKYVEWLLHRLQLAKFKDDTYTVL